MEISKKTKNTEGLNELLFKEAIDFSKVTEEDKLLFYYFSRIKL